MYRITVSGKTSYSAHYIYKVKHFTADFIHKDVVKYLEFLRSITSFFFTYNNIIKKIT